MSRILEPFIIFVYEGHLNMDTGFVNRTPGLAYLHTDDIFIEQHRTILKITQLSIARCSRHNDKISYDENVVRYVENCRICFQSVLGTIIIFYEIVKNKYNSSDER